MNLIHEVAQRFDIYDNNSLVDFFIVHIPCQVLSVDTVGIEKSNVPPLTEFILKAILAGLCSVEKVSRLLGLNLAYCRGLMRDLEIGEYIGTDSFGSYSVWRRGKEMVMANGENVPVDRRLNIVWDPISRKFIGRVAMYTRRLADRDGVIIPIVGAFALPSLRDVGPAALRESQLSASGGRGGRTSTYEVLRVTAIHKSIARFREAVVLVYKSDKSEYTLKLAVEGKVDEELTTACAQASVAKLVGVDKSFSSRHGGLGIRKRYADISKGQGSLATLEVLVRRRSVVRFRLATLNTRIIEGPTIELAAKQIEVLSELKSIAAQLEDSPITPVRCHETREYLLDAFRKADHEVIITTSLPTDEKLDYEVFEELRACLARNIAVTIYIADRPNSENGSILARLDKLMQTKTLKVFFLTNLLRPIFEISWDSSGLWFSNDPPLGRRRGPIVPREFAGYFISRGDLIERYLSDHMTFAKADIITRILHQTRDAKLVSEIGKPKLPSRRASATKRLV